MRRSSDNPSTVPEAIKSQRVAAAELARQHGRGATALRNNSGHIMLLDSSSKNPLLRPLAADGTGDPVPGLLFDAFGVRIVNPAAQNQHGDLTANAIATDSFLHTSGVITADGGMAAGGTVTANAGLVSNGTSTFNAQVNMGTNKIYCGDIFATSVSTSGVGSFQGVSVTGDITMGVGRVWCGDVHGLGIFYTSLNAVSDPTTKKNLRKPVAVFGKRAIDVVAAAPASVYQFRGDVPAVKSQADKDKIGPMATDLPSVARSTCVIRATDDTGRVTFTELPGLDLSAMVGILWAAVGEIAAALPGPPGGATAHAATASDEVAELRATVARQQEQIDTLAGRVEALEAA